MASKISWGLGAFVAAKITPANQSEDGTWNLKKSPTFTGRLSSSF
jgi:hypothetical protein